MTTKSYGAIYDLGEFETLVDSILRDGQPFGFDIETGYLGPTRESASLHPEENIVVGFSFTNSTDWARYIPLAHDVGLNVDNHDFAHICWRLLSSGLGVPHNAKFELRNLATFFRYWLEDDHPAQATKGYYPVRSDTMIEAYILAEWKSYGLKNLVKDIFDHEQATLMSLFPELKKKDLKSIRFNLLELTPQVVSYACEDALWALALHLRHYPRVKDNFLYKVEMSLLQQVCDMEDYGLLYDWAMMQTSAVALKEFMEHSYSEIMSAVSAMLGYPVKVNLGSPPQIAKLLFEDLGLKSSRKTKGSGMVRPDGTVAPVKLSTDATALATLAKTHPVVKSILEWKEQKTLLTRYLAKYQVDYSYAKDGRTHPDHMQTAVPSGRFAVGGPPYQQTPKKYHYTLLSGAEFILEFRLIIKAGQGHYFMGFDYSQVELRVMAGEAQEPSLIQAFIRGDDPHSITASLMLGVQLAQVTGDHRSVGKTMNFALLYGMGPKSLAERLGISRDEASALYDQFFSSYSAIKAWVERVTAEGKARGYSISKFGRRFTIWELQSHEPWIYSKGERLCVNAPIQGGAADYMKIAMVRCNAALRRAGLLDAVHLVMNIHDALIFEVDQSVSPQTVYDVVQPAVTFPVEGWPKITTDWSIGRRWGDMRAIEPGPDGVLRPSGASGSSGSAQQAVQDDDGDSDEFPEIDADPEALRAALSPRRETYVSDTSPPPLDGSESPLPATQPSVRSTPESAPEPSVVGSPVTPSSRQRDEPRALLVRLGDMPSQDSFSRFMAMVAASPGVNSVVLQTPEGNFDVPLSAGGTGLSPGDGPALSLIFGGAEVGWAPESVDAGDIVSGLNL